MRAAQFVPYVHVKQDGTIDTDWADSFVNVIDADGNDVLGDEGQWGIDVLDERLDEIRRVIGSYDAFSGCDGYDGASIADQLVELIRPFFNA